MSYMLEDDRVDNQRGIVSTNSVNCDKFRENSQSVQPYRTIVFEETHYRWFLWLWRTLQNILLHSATMWSCWESEYL